MYSILFVCKGNICRSPSAEAVMKHKVKKLGREADFYIDSAGIVAVHEGNFADSRMREEAQKRGISLDSISRPVNADDFDRFDLIIGMDDANLDALCDKSPTLEAKGKISKMTDYALSMNYDYVPDPYYGGVKGFELVLDILDDACNGLLCTCK